MFALNLFRGDDSDGAADFLGYGANVGANLYAFDSALYAGTLMVKMGNPLPFISPVFDGADIWGATGPAESLVWTRVTGDGFGDEEIQHFEAFCTFNNSLYVAASNVFGGNPGQTIPEISGAKIYRLKEMPNIAGITAFEIAPAMNTITLTWESDAEPDCVGFHVYRSTSEKKNTPYKRRNWRMIEATGSPLGGGAYTFTDRFGPFTTTLFYKIESVSPSGERSFVGPLNVTVGGE